MSDDRKRWTGAKAEAVKWAARGGAKLEEIRVGSTVDSTYYLSTMRIGAGTVWGVGG